MVGAEKTRAYGREHRPNSVGRAGNKRPTVYDQLSGSPNVRSLAKAELIAGLQGPAIPELVEKGRVFEISGPYRGLDYWRIIQPRAACLGSIGLPPITADKICRRQFCCVPGPRESRLTPRRAVCFRSPSRPRCGGLANERTLS